MAVRILILGTDWTNVRLVDADEFMKCARIDPQSRGIPAIGCWGGNALHLWPLPDEAVTKIEIDFNGSLEESAD